MVAAHSPRPLDLGTSFDELLGAARQGSPAAFDTLYRSLAGRVCGYLRMHGAPEPEDLTSELFLRVFDRLESFVGDETQFRAWVFTIAHRLLIDDRRRRGCRPQTTHFAETSESTLVGGNAEHEALGSLDRQAVAETLASLPKDQRDVLMLRVLGDLSIDEVARALDKRPGAVKQLQRRGIARLRRHLNQGTTP